MNVRAATAEVIAGVLRGQSLSVLLPGYSEKVDDKDRALLKQLCFGTMRWYPQIALLLKQLVQKPLREKDLEIQGLLACGLYQLLHMRIPEHAIINETVAASEKLKRRWAKGLVNAVLRNFQRQQAALMAAQTDNAVFAAAHPKWLLHKIADSWPQYQDEIIAANNAQAPMVLRVNALHNSRSDYLDLLAQSGIEASATDYSVQGVILATAKDVTELPKFSQGAVSVQDEAAQLATSLLDLQAGQSVLDACCAPGGKTCHILESRQDLGSVLAIDLEPKRLTRVKDNLARLNLNAILKAADAADTGQWWDGSPFDRILLDAPCSATGVIRRHPDIKILRKPADIVKLSAIQLRLLESLWQTLANKGVLLYATCSILPEENDQVVQQFLQNHADASLLTIDADWGIATDFGRQLLPTINGNDGFYYARLQKNG